jgi:hypothetical protein
MQGGSLLTLRPGPAAITREIISSDMSVPQNTVRHIHGSMERGSAIAQSPVTGI